MSHACVCCVRVSAVGELRAEFSRINWFSSWVIVDVCSCSDAKTASMFSSINSTGVPWVGSSVGALHNAELLTVSRPNSYHRWGPFSTRLWQYSVNQVLKCKSNARMSIAWCFYTFLRKFLHKFSRAEISFWLMKLSFIIEICRIFNIQVLSLGFFPTFMVISRDWTRWFPSSKALNCFRKTTFLWRFCPLLVKKACFFKHAACYGK